MVNFRWRLFRLLSAVAWRICPEPHKSALQASMTIDKVMWDNPDRAFARDYAGRARRSQGGEG